MSVKTMVLRYAKQLKKGEMFATKQLSRIARRGALDQALSQLVRKGILERLARGVFRLARPDNDKPNLFEVIKFKAAVFGRKIVTHGKDALKKLNLHKHGNSDLRLACNGKSSSFRALGVFVHLVGITKNRVRAGDGKGGLLVRALAEPGQRSKRSIIVNALKQFDSEDMVELNERLPPLMTCWMSDLIFHSGFS